MAFTINNNPMNPVPLWDSKTKWQIKQPTFHDAMAWPIVNKGKTPAMALTLSGELPPASNNTSSLTISGCSVSAINRIYSGRIETADGGSNITLGTVGSTDPYIVIMRVSSTLWRLTLRHGLLTTYIMYDAYGVSEFTLEQLRQGGSFTIKTPDGDIPAYSYSITVSRVKLNYQYSHTNDIKIDIYKLDGDTAVLQNIYTNVNLDGCLPYYTPERCGHMWIPPITIANSIDDGVYYMKVRVTLRYDSTTSYVEMYSEPFLWITNFIPAHTTVHYRRSVPVITTENFIDFTDHTGNARYLDMILPNAVQKARRKFNVDNVDNGGYIYVKSQTSYRQDHIDFHCYDAFLDAIRLLWHCDIRYVNNKRIDYIEPPEMEWNTDNHLCDVSLDFHSDTVVQTNGVASAYLDSSDANHQSYDASFDQSFN